MVENEKHNIYHILMKKSCLYFDKKYKCVLFIVHYKGLTLSTTAFITHGSCISVNHMKNLNADLHLP